MLMSMLLLLLLLMALRGWGLLLRLRLGCQVLEHQSEDSCWIIYKDKVYNVTDFVSDHPGGRDIMLEFAGTDITDVLGDASMHMHSVAAYELLEEYYIGELATSCSSDVGTPPLSVNSRVSSDDDLDTPPELNVHVKKGDVYHPKKPNPMARDDIFLDLRKPLFPQLWNATYSKDFYLEQVHRPRFVSHYVPYFSHPWLDLLSHTPWYVVPIVWLPFVTYQLWCSLNTLNASPLNTLEAFAGGVFFWSLLEYLLHRFVFHLDEWLPDHPIALLFHFTLHGIHHHMPMDRLRLVMPPALTVIIGGPVIQLVHSLFKTTTAHAVVAGAFFGYVSYDLIHYYLHHAQVIRIHFREMKRYHLAHHYKNYDGGYGITSKIWDYVFNTPLQT
ncbi:hypothetical protein BJV82DRAFT_645327 [Fennellomyces sp. T-0311]|nr:hypothetical protein BJV82DRAFT_645327 [Fennellomyces sp. T-0311]